MVGVLVSALLPAALQVLIDRLASRQLLDLFSRRTIAASAAAAAAEKLKLQLLSVNAVLADAEEKQIVNPYVKIWVDELRETVYHGQDLLDQIATEVLRLNLVSKSNTAMEWVREFLDSITSKLNSSLDEINIRIQVLRDQKDCLGLRELHEKQSQLELGSADLMYVPTTRMVDQSKVYGRDHEKDEIIRLMFAAMSEQVDPVCVVAIVGMAGIGKTTLSQLLFNDPRLVPMFDTLSWIQVSAGSDVLHLTRKVCESMSDNLDTLQVELNSKLKRQRLLLVLDDFWSVSFSDWELFKMAFSHAIPGSVILVTTRNGDVATTIRAAVTYFLSPLPYEDCWDVFAHCAFGSTNLSTADPTLVEIGEKIVRKCKGLPLAAKVLGSLLHLVTDAREWNVILQSKMWDLDAKKSNILPALRLSYQLLPSHLKACFAYCSVFPKGYEIDRVNLIHLWMAEGLLQPSKTKTMHDVGEQYLQELLSRSLLQRPTGNDLCVIMHDLISDLAQYVGGEFFHFFEEGGDQKIPDKVRHLSFSKDKLDVPKRYLSQVWTFLPFKDSNSSRQFDSLTDNDFNSVIPMFERIRVLSLSSYPISTLPSTIGNLKHLRYLNLSYTRIQELPSSTGCLYNLQVLLLAHCDCLTSLPKDLENLTDLHHLDVIGAPLVEMPPNFGRLKLLRHLTTFIVGKSSGSRISELGALSQLHGLLSIVNLQNVIDATEASGANLMMKTFIDELVFEWTNDVHNLSKEAIVLYNLQPHKNLKRLKIENYGGRTFPEWLGNPLFSNLVSVQLIGCISCLTLPPLGQLNSLKTLLIAKMTWLERVGLEFYGNTNSPFRVLEVLTFKDMHRWKEWLQIDIEECFPSLEELHIQNCPKLTGNLPQRLRSLNKLVIAKCSINSLPRVPMLRELELFDCDELMSLPREMMQGNEHVSKVSIYNCSSLKYVPALGLPIRLESLYIGKCRNLKLYPEEHMIEHLHLEDSCDSLIILSLSSFSRLRHLHIQGCPNLGSLSISNEFTEELYHLEKIQLKDCPNLVFFPYGGLRTPNLQVLSISNCKKLAPQKEWGLHEMLSLSYFGIEGELTGLESFPDEGLLPACLTDLHIMGLEDLTSLNHDGLQHLVALKNLVIEGCSMLEFLPSQGLPGSLSNLIIADCPLLVPLCQFETGAYWPLIAHIPNKDIV
ncbi:putative disease resistance RPP13-like protein 1 [Arachis stenosperma]|uniref:putative disease resistance RPP13-like protein 1 n=1 Tax=Arachis stenosperma TaxID=217475 RepID=UPI0025AD5248|nr:putative disease resistance RPP13-like protein 1 [Arachis stenosperma]